MSFTLIHTCKEEVLRQRVREFVPPSTDYTLFFGSTVGHRNSGRECRSLLREMDAGLRSLMCFRIVLCPKPDLVVTLEITRKQDAYLLTHRTDKKPETIV